MERNHWWHNENLQKKLNQCFEFRVLCKYSRQYICRTWISRGSVSRGSSFQTRLQVDEISLDKCNPSWRITQQFSSWKPTTKMEHFGRGYPWSLRLTGDPQLHRRRELISTRYNYIHISRHCFNLGTSSGESTSQNIPCWDVTVINYRS